MALAHDVIKSSMERSDRECTVAKRLPEGLLCNLLGLSGLAWDDQSLLAPVWLTLHQQPDKASKALVLRTFFQDLGKQEPAFSQFRNSMLFEHITAHKFEPGAAFDTCHHGISLLAVSMRSFAAQERERQDDDDFDMATNKTPEAVRKHSAKAPPPLPTTIAELLQSMWRLVVLTTGLFTPMCSLAIQLKDLHRAIQQREQMLMGEPNIVATLIPQLVWAVTTAAREFYGSISTRSDVDPPDDDSSPRVAVAQLSIHTTLFKAGIALNLTNLPDQWKRKTPGVTQHQQRNDHKGNNSGGHERKHGNNPFQPATDGAPPEKVNKQYSSAFATTDFKKLKQKMRRVTLSQITHEAGIRGGPSQLNITGWPPNACLNFLCMGVCRRQSCINDHPTSTDEATAISVYKQLEPGITRLLETGKRSKPGK
jgi:hypothetical protein